MDICKSLTILSLLNVIFIGICIRLAYIEYHPGVFKAKLPKGSFKDSLYTLLQHEDEPADGKNLQLFSLNVTNDDLDKMRVVSNFIQLMITL